MDQAEVHLIKEIRGCSHSLLVYILFFSFPLRVSMPGSCTDLCFTFSFQLELIVQDAAGAIGIS